MSLSSISLLLCTEKSARSVKHVPCKGQLAIEWKSCMADAQSLSLRAKNLHLSTLHIHARLLGHGVTKHG